MEEFPKIYNSREVEDAIYEKWETAGFFNPDTAHSANYKLQTTNYFSISMPPPNATGELHLGHAAMLALQDIMTRYRRMKGDAALWLPGTDHASIATQNKVEKILQKEKGISRHDLGRVQFLKEVEAFVLKSRAVIKNQIRKMGASCDWSRERYTLDKGLTSAVGEVFTRMHKDGLIYRGNRIVNWCPRCASTLADDEVEYKTVKGKFYYFRYGPIVIGTARPETKFCDKTIVVHPKDSRYKKLIGKKFMVPWIDGEVQAVVIADICVDRKLGSGAMTLTPAHSFIDFDLAQKYKLPIVQIINERGNLTDAAGEFAGMNAYKAREAIVEKMRIKGLVERIDEHYEHNLSVCYRCDTPIEPLVSRQWFIDVNKEVKIKKQELRKIVGKDKASLKEISVAVVKKGAIKIIPNRFDKIYFHWMENLRDWCISRQIWFGHRVPVWYCKARSKNYELRIKNKRSNTAQCNNVIVSVEKPTHCFKCGGNKFTQDPDTLDTWFSSGLWTFSTLGWPFIKMEIAAARHGHTDIHNKPVFVGQEKKTDAQLSKKGKVQAQRLAELLKKEKFDLIFTADLKRCEETAKIVNQYHNIPIIPDKRLREYRFGFMNGKTHYELCKAFPDLPTWQDLKINQQYKDEETPLSMKRRVESFLRDVQTMYPDKRIFISTSSGVLDFFDMISHGKKFEEIKTLKHEMCVLEQYEFKNTELASFHPTTVMETGYDILFFWVARMILMSTYALGEVPFKTVYLHGLVRDKLGRKMSKSLGNGIDPVEMIKKYGADAVRLSLVIGTTPGNDTRLYEEKIAGYRNFVNKVWNISRFVLTAKQNANSKLKTQNSKPQLKTKNFTLADHWIVYELSELVKKVNKNMENYRFSAVGEDIYEFMWHKLADKYIEETKREKLEHQQAVLEYILEKCLIMLHPFVPFVTECIWEKFKTQSSKLKITTKNPKPFSDLLIIQPWVEKIDFTVSKARALEFIKTRETKKQPTLSEAEKKELASYIASLEKRLKNKQFLAKAPKEVVEKEKARLLEARAKIGAA